MPNRVIFDRGGDELSVLPEGQINIQDGAKFRMGDDDKTLALTALRPAGPLVIAATSYTLTADDTDWIVTDAADPVTITFPAHATLPLQIGSRRRFRQRGAGTMVFSGAVGVTVTVPFGRVASANGTGKVVEAIKESANAWHLFGDLDTD